MPRGPYKPNRRRATMTANDMMTLRALLERVPTPTFCAR